MSHTTDDRFAETRTFTAPTMRDALALVREEFGDAAVILRSREVERTGLGRWLTGPEIEVTAALERNPTERSARSTGESRSEPIESPALRQGHARRTDDGPSEDSSEDDGPAFRRGYVPQERRPVFERLAEPPEPPRPPLASFGQLNLSDGESLREEIARIGEAVERLAATPGESPVIAELAEVGVVGPVATRIAKDAERVLGEGVRPDAALRAAVAARITVDPERPFAAGEQRRIALVGPSGVGKTTTLAKLAAASILNDGRSVGLISLDTQRMAASDQIKSYAELLSVPLRVVSTNEQARRAAGEMADCDVILVDTPGCGPRDGERVADVQARLRAIGPDEIVVCLSAVTGTPHNRAAAAVFEPLRPTAFIATKVDEADQLGSLVGLCEEIEWPLQLITTGQEVPTDFEWADADRLARLTLGVDELIEAPAERRAA